MTKPKYQLSVKLTKKDGSTKILCLLGRDGWAMDQLISAGERGCTPIDNPAPRWASYIYDLRQLGVSIETVTEPHGGVFAGNHGRYVLRDVAEIISKLEGQGGRAHAIRHPV